MSFLNDGIETLASARGMPWNPSISQDIVSEMQQELNQLASSHSHITSSSEFVVLANGIEELVRCEDLPIGAEISQEMADEMEIAWKKLQSAIN